MAILSMSKTDYKNCLLAMITGIRHNELDSHGQVGWMPRLPAAGAGRKADPLIISTFPVKKVETAAMEPQNWVYEIPLETISREVARAIGCGEDELYSTRRARRGSHGRGIVAYLARRISTYTVREIADHFRRSSVTVSEAITKVEGLLRKDVALAKTLELLSEILIKGRKRKYRITEA